MRAGDELAEHGFLRTGQSIPGHLFCCCYRDVLIFADRCCSKARGTSSVPLRVWHQALAISVLRAPVENLRLDVESRALEKIYLIFFSLFLALHAACGNQPEMEPKPLALEEHSLSHWTTREVPRYI